MKKSINILATAIALALYFAIVAPLTIGGMALFGNFVMHTAYDFFGISHDLFPTIVGLFLIVLPVGLAWTFLVCMTYCKLMNKIKRPFITPMIPVFKTL